MPLNSHPDSLCDSSFRAMILSGGEAKRAGGINKSFMQIEGRAIIEHQLARLRPVFAERITIVTDRASDFASLGIECVPDRPIAGLQEERSSLRGLYSALSLEGGDWRFVLACDMPFPDMEIAEAQWRALKMESEHREVRGATLYKTKGPAPNHAIYRADLAPTIEAILTAPAAQKAAKRRELSIRRWIESTPTILTLHPTDVGFDYARIERCLSNFNFVGAAGTSSDLRT